MAKIQLVQVAAGNSLIFSLNPPDNLHKSLKHENEEPQGFSLAPKPLLLPEWFHAA
jgi:hypothetical protein